MNELSERRLAENELEFRHVNTKNKGRQQRESDMQDDPLILDCYCECANKHCHERIQLTAKEYEEIHQDNKQFIALAGHENRSIEQVVRQMEEFNIIEKYNDPSEVTRGHAA
jgi:hypothetical protein